MPTIPASSAQFTAWKLTTEVDEVEYNLTSATTTNATETAAAAIWACHAPAVARRSTASAKAIESDTKTKLTCSNATTARPGELISINATNEAIETQTATKATTNGKSRHTNRP